MISIVIPTLDEAARLPELLDALGRERTPHEVIVVDGGSSDATVAIAQGRGARVVVAPPSRGGQLRAGAADAAGHVFLFLHADCVFPPGGLERITERLAGQPACVGGNFRLVFEGNDRFSRWLTRVYDWNRRRRHRYYGDSGIFVRRETYRMIGGMRPLALMEDLDFVRRLERHGLTCQIEDPPLMTSSRRFSGRHPVAIVWGWLKIHALFDFGVSAGRLARMYGSGPRL